ncbi:MAG: hypothetical protein FRX49_01586 [Trebouxia sp. A1-2]|nr:MAG: hypothetical protein FRX49_01586 [Trebouxia sp. A1-2]
MSDGEVDMSLSQSPSMNLRCDTCKYTAAVIENHSETLILVLKGQGITARHLNGEGGAQLEVPSNTPGLLASFSDILMQEQSVAIWTIRNLGILAIRVVEAQADLAGTVSPRRSLSPGRTGPELLMSSARMTASMSFSLSAEACDGGLHPAPQLQGGGGFPSQEPEGVTDCELAWVLGAQIRVWQDQLKGDVYESGQPVGLVLVLLQPEAETLQQRVSGCIKVKSHSKIQLLYKLWLADGLLDSNLVIIIQVGELAALQGLLAHGNGPLVRLRMNSGVIKRVQLLIERLILRAPAAFLHASMHKELTCGQGRQAE